MTLKDMTPWYRFISNNTQNLKAFVLHKHCSADCMRGFMGYMRST